MKKFLNLKQRKKKFYFSPISLLKIVNFFVQAKRFIWQGISATYAKLNFLLVNAPNICLGLIAQAIR